MRGWMRRGVVRIGGVLGDSSFTVDLFGGQAARTNFVGGNGFHRILDAYISALRNFDGGRVCKQPSMGPKESP